MAAKNDRVGRRYAKALFDSISPDSYSTVQSILDRLASAWSGHHDFRSALGDPTLSTEQKIELVRSVALGAGQDGTQELKNFLSLLVTSRRINVIVAVRDEVAALVRGSQKTVAVDVVSSAIVPEEERKRIASELSSKMGREITVDWKVQEDMVGGLVIRVGDKLIDRSIAGALQQLRTKIAA